MPASLAILPAAALIDLLLLRVALVFVGLAALLAVALLMGLWCLSSLEEAAEFGQEPLNRLSL